MWHNWAVWLSVFCVLIQLSQILRATGRILQIFCLESPGSYPEYPGPDAKTHIYWVDNMSYASHMSLHTPAHPTVDYIRASLFFLEIYANCWHIKSNLKFKFMAYLKGELLYASRLSLYDYQMSYMWVVINHQKRGDWKWSRPLSGFWWLMTKHMCI